MMKIEEVRSHDERLPIEVIVAILEKLPIRDAARTSILSRQWRQRWTMMQCLRFKGDDSLSKATTKTKALLNIIDQALIVHTGPVRVFELYADVLDAANLSRWLIFLSRDGRLERLVLKFSGKDYQRMHSSLFSCRGISELTLYNCSLKLPQCFDGFANLLSLDLKECKLPQGDLQSLISKCPLLKKLTIAYVSNCGTLKIDNPRLEYFSFIGNMKDIYIVRAPLLKELYIELSKPANMYCSNISKILASSRSIEKLHLREYAAQFFAGDNREKELPIVFACLKSLCLCISFEDIKEISLLLSLLRRSSPYLQELTVYEACIGCTESSNKEKQLWELNKNLNALNHLKFVYLEDFGCRGPEMEFIKFVLAHAPVLEKMNIKICDNSSTCKEDVLINLLRFQRASRQAEIIISR